MSNTDANQKNPKTVEAEPVEVSLGEEIAPADEDEIAGAGGMWGVPNHNETEAEPAPTAEPADTESEEIAPADEDEIAGAGGMWNHNETEA